MGTDGDCLLRAPGDEDQGRAGIWSGESGQSGYCSLPESDGLLRVEQDLHHGLSFRFRPQPSQGLQGLLAQFQGFGGVGGDSGQCYLGGGFFSFFQGAGHLHPDLQRLSAVFQAAEQGNRRAPPL
jgi:hypothetical protein